RTDLVERRVQVDRRPIAVPAGVHAAAHTAARHLVHDDVRALDDGLVVPAPLLEERPSSLLLHLVVGLRALRALLVDPHRTAAGARSDTRGRTSVARIRMCSR